MEIIYGCISKLASSIIKAGVHKLPEQIKHDADPNDYNRIFYHQRNSDMEEIIRI